MATSSNSDVIFPQAVWNIGLVLFAIVVPFILIPLALMIGSAVGLAPMSRTAQVLMIAGSIAVGLLALKSIRSRLWIRMLIEVFYVLIILPPITIFYLLVGTFAACGICMIPWG